MIAMLEWGGGGDKGGAPTAPRRCRLLLLTGLRGAATGCHIRAELRHAPNARASEQGEEGDCLVVCLPGSCPGGYAAARSGLCGV